MKKIYIITLLLILTTSNIFSQSGWFFQNPLPTSNTVVKIKYLNTSFGIGVGDFGTVIKTTNGGNLWTSFQNLTPSNLKNLCILDTSKIFVVGMDGVAFKSTNSGLNWYRINLGSNSQFNDITFLDSNTGFIVGQGRILKTINGGDNWTTLVVTTEVNSICFVNMNTGFLACSLNIIYKTTNCGVNWNIINPEISSVQWYSIYFKDENNGLLFGTGGKIIKTSNGGINWALTTTNTSEAILSYNFRDSNTVYAGGENGILLKTTNFGINWVSMASGQSNRFISSIFIYNDSSFGTLACAPCPPCYYDILSSSNNGTNWNSQLKGIRTHIKSLDFINVNTGVAVGSYGGILRTTNGGGNWSTISSDLNYTNSDIQLFSSGIGYICGATNFILKTSNFGLNWVQIGIVSGTSYNALSFVNENTGFVVGAYSVIFPPPGFFEPKVLKTTNGGVTFTNLRNGINSTPLNIQMVDENNIFIAGYDVYKSTNSGNNWTNVFTSTYTKQSIFFFDANTGVIGGGYKVVRTTNAGVNWQESNVPTNFYCISFINSNLGIAVGYNYINAGILKTVNGGITWQFSNGVTSNVLNSVELVSQDVVYAGGEQGTIIKSTNGGGPIGIQTTSNKIPEFYSLRQNYPNPFNPVTKIKFDIPKLSNVKVIIYDLLGREIAAIVNEQLKAGVYEADWDGSNFASGVYFYSLVTDEFIETKRMVLIK